MKYLILISASLLSVVSHAQSMQNPTYKTYGNDSSKQYYLGIKQTPGLEMPNIYEGVDTTAALREHPMIKDPLDIIDGLGVMRIKLMENDSSGFRKYDFQKPEKYEDELNFFTPKFKK